MNVLCVEDNPLNAKLFKRLFEKDGHNCVLAENSEEAWDALSIPPLPDLILMDMALPGVSGSILAHQIKARKEFAAIPIVGVTAFLTEEDQHEANGCFVAFFQKPLDTRRFVGDVLAIWESHK